MQVVMFDRQSIFIHGMNVSLQQRIPGVDVQGVSQADELWLTLEDKPEALVILDGDLDAEFCCSLLQQIAERFAMVKVLVNTTDCRKKWLQEVTKLNVLAIVPRDSQRLHNRYRKRWAKYQIAQRTSAGDFDHAGRRRI